MRRALFCVLVTTMMLAASLALADAPRVGVVTGEVTGPDGAPMPGATVQLLSERGAESAVSGADGSFRFLFVIPDSYTVRADLAGFQAAQGEIVVTAGGRADVTLQLSDVAGQEIVITGEAPLVNKFDVTTGGTVAAKEIASIVAPTRGYISLLNFLPEVTPSAETGLTPDVAGNTWWRTTFYVDGVDTSFGRFGGTTQIRLPTNSVGQMQLLTGRADAEFSRTMGGVSTVTVKSGTNDFHGDFSATFQNQAWDSTYDAFPTAEPPDELDVRWEAALGGPIARDRLWFFVAAADQGSSSYAVLPSQAQVDVEVTVDATVAKLDYRPSSEHSLSLTAAESPSSWPYYAANNGDVYSGAFFEQGGQFATARWSWAISEDLFLDTAAAYQNTDDTRSNIAVRPVDAAAPASSPAANPGIVYADLNTGLYWNATALALGPGSVAYPRYQGNVAVNWFAGDHDVKVGVDYQDTQWEVASKSLPVAFGRGFDYSAPGGFTSTTYVPFLRVYVGPADFGGVTNKSKTWAAFVRDRLTIGEHWTINAGLRLDDQTHWNDIGTEIFASTDLAPRLTVVYDVNADSKLLITAGAGRYYDWIPMSLTEDFNTVPQQRKEYDQFSWNRATQAYDTFVRHVSAVSNIASNTIEPAYRDEYTLGLEWAFHPNWAFKANAQYYEQKDQYLSENQILDDGSVGYEYLNNPFGRHERLAVTLLAQRRFRDNWMLSTSYTWQDSTGTCFNVNNLYCWHGLGELYDLTNPDTGEPWSVENRDGEIANGYDHSVKVRGAYLLPLGKGHTLNLGGLGWWRTGRKYNWYENVTPITGQTVIHYLEPMGSRELDGVYQLDLNASWRFPIAKGIQGSLLVEVINVTDQQDRISVSDAMMLQHDIEYRVTTANIQNPRTMRALATISF